MNDSVEMSALVGQRLDVGCTGGVSNSHVKNADGAIGGIGIVGTRDRAKKFLRFRKSCGRRRANPDASRFASAIVRDQRVASAIAD